MTSLWLQAASAFGAGIGISLSPCVYPMIPISVGFLGSSAEDGVRTQRLRILGFFLGQVLAFTALGIVAVSLGEILGFSSEIPWVQISIGVLLLAFAYASFFDRLPGFANRWSSRIGQRPGNTLVGAFAVGASSAAIASPCTSPVVGAVLATVSQVENRLWGVSLMAIFAIGMSFLFLLIGLGLAKAKSLPRAGSWMVVIHKASSVALAAGGVYFIYRGLR